MAQWQQTAPAANPVTLTEALAFLRVEAESPATASQALIESQIAAATAWAEGFTRRAFIHQTWKITLPAFPAGSDALELPLGKAASIQRIEYITPAGATMTMTGPSSSPAGAGFREYLASPQGSMLLPARGATWPATIDDEPAAVTVTFVAGYGAGPSTVPEPIRHAILYRLADLYDNRGSGDGTWTDVAAVTLRPYALRDQQ
jgi:uncharacterized phiE125 gp8 family phage protein